MSMRSICKEFGFLWESCRRWLKALGNYEAIPIEALSALAAIRRTGIAFYTNPTGTGIPWLYLLTNVYRVQETAKLVEHMRSTGVNTSKISIILDAGVERYWKKSCSEASFDYDDRYWNTFWSAVDMLKSLRSEYWFFFEVTVPDYPDDYTRAWRKQHCLWVDSYTNIDRTLENVFYVVEQDKGVKWLLPAQGYENIPESILLSLEVYVSQGLHKRYRVALANLCTTNFVTGIVETIRLAREFCQECSFHIFGPKITAVERAAKQRLLRAGDSWDSFSWMMTSIEYSRGWRSIYNAASAKEREFMLKQYLKKIASILKQVA